MPIFVNISTVSVYIIPFYVVDSACTCFPGDDFLLMDLNLAQYLAPYVSPYSSTRRSQSGGICPCCSKVLTFCLKVCQQSFSCN